MSFFTALAEMPQQQGYSAISASFLDTGFLV
jgi:hypothetical protein